MPYGPFEGLTLDQLRRMGPAQAMREHQMDMGDSAKLQAMLNQPSQFQRPAAAPPSPPGIFASLLELLMNPGKNVTPTRNILQGLGDAGPNGRIPNVYRGPLQPRDALPPMSPAAYPDWQRRT